MSGERQFVFDLALALHQPDPDRMLASMPYRTLLEWQQYFETVPHAYWRVAEQRADIRAAIIAKVIADVNRGKGQRPYKIEQFLIDWEKLTQGPPTPDDLLDKMLAIFGDRAEIVDLRDTTDGD